MKTILAKTPHDSSFSLSKRYFNWKKKVVEDDNAEEDDEEEEILSRFNSSSHFNSGEEEAKKKNRVSKLKHALTVFKKARPGNHSGLGSRVVGTLFGHRRGHVHFAVQDDPNHFPAVLIELPISTSVLVREMASGLVRIALECEKKVDGGGGGGGGGGWKKGSLRKLLEEPTWRTYCNGKKCGFSARRECGPEEWRVLRAVGPITMGAGVIPAAGDGGGGGGEGEGNGAVGSEMGELMYMRARFERVVGSRDSEAFYMMNPDGTTGGPELSVYLLRV